MEEKCFRSQLRVYIHEYPIGMLDDRDTQVMEMTAYKTLDCCG
jgi:hypothetical protein